MANPFKPFFEALLELRRKAKMLILEKASEHHERGTYPKRPKKGRKGNR